MEEGGEGLCCVVDLAPFSGVGGEGVGVQEVVDSEGFEVWVGRED